MICPKCGSPRLKYIISRKKYWKKSNQGTAAVEERKDFRVKCSQCGYEGKENNA